MRILRNMVPLIFLAFIHTLMFPSDAFSDILQVPITYQTIQEAINASKPGDTIIVRPGEYRLAPENITIREKNLTLKSASGAAKTIIVGGGNSSVISLSEGCRAVIDGFTITAINEKGISVLRGGGIYCAPSSSPVIINNIITGNNAVFGGAVYCDRLSSPVIANNIISKNTAERFGGGIFSYRASPIIYNNRLMENEAANSGGGIFCNRDFPRITHNIIWKNKANHGGGISCDWSSSAMINDTITANMAFYGGGIYIANIAKASVRMTNLILWHNKDDLYYDALRPASRPEYSNIGDGDFRGLNGNISADPLFVDPENGDFHLRPGSPSIDTGNQEPIYKDPDGSRNDMGAYGGPQGLVNFGEVSSHE